MSWIFQAITSRYDLRKEMEENKSVVWLVTKYREKIKQDDVVYFWQAGPQNIRGMYGWGVIVGNVKRFRDWGYGVPVEYKKIFNPHISVTVFKSDPHLENHVLLRMPIGTNFKLSPEEDDAIKRIIVKEFDKGMSP